jgi:uncharacterized protein (DUF1501 family)
MREDWWSCDGGPSKIEVEPSEEVSTPGIQLTRRGLFVSAGLGAISWLASGQSALSQVALTPSVNPDSQVLVVIFLRGGADGLNVVVPYGEDAYYRLRPSLHVPSPRDAGAAERDRALDLNGFFGLHPGLAPIHDLYHSKELSFVHACGSFDHTRSHFDAMSAMERGLPEASGSVASGWLARHLNSSGGPTKSSPLRAVAFGNVMPDSLRGASDAISLESLMDFRLAVEDSKRAEMESALHHLYSKGKDAVSQAGQDTLAAMKSLNRLDMQTYGPESGALYPKSDLGDGLKQVAMLIKSGVGLEVACLDKGGWDTHVAQGATTGWQALLMDDLSKSLAAFSKDLGGRKSHVTTLVMTEFGRRAYENSGLGTDHGRGSFMMLMGGGTVGGQVFGKWPGLEDHQLEGPGDLHVTTDYRNVLAEVLTKKLGNTQTTEVFPGLAFDAPGFTA